MTDELKIELQAIKQKVATHFQLNPDSIEHDLELWDNGEFALILVVPQRVYHSMCTSCASKQFMQKHKKDFPDTEIGYISFSYKHTMLGG